MSILSAIKNYAMDLLGINDSHLTIASKNDFSNTEFGGDFILAFGSEANGISEDIINLSDEKVTFFMDNDVESLNLGVCASIAFAFLKMKKGCK